MTATVRPAPAGAGRTVQSKLDESLTEPASHEMSTIDLSASRPGRHQIGMVAGFGSERWPTSRRNNGRLPVGISGRLRRNTHLFHAQEKTIVGKPRMVTIPLLDTPTRSRNARSEQITITDPRHPLYGRSFPLISVTGLRHGNGHAYIDDRGRAVLSILIEVTSGLNAIGPAIQQALARGHSGSGSGCLPGGRDPAAGPANRCLPLTRK